MVTNPVSLNTYSPSPALQSIAAYRTASGNQYAFSGGSASNNSSRPTNNYGVGLVNSSLSNMSYKLPNGEQTTCNTIGVG